MLYASCREDLKNVLGTTLFLPTHYFITDLSEFTFENVTNVISPNQKSGNANENANDMLSSHEIEIKNEKYQAEQAKGEAMFNSKATAMKTVAFPLSDELGQSVQDFSNQKLNFIEMKVDEETEANTHRTFPPQLQPLHAQAHSIYIYTHILPLC